MLLQGDRKGTEKRRDWGQAGALKTLEPRLSPHQSISKVLQYPLPLAQASSYIHAEHLPLLCVSWLLPLFCLPAGNV